MQRAFAFPQLLLCDIIERRLSLVSVITASRKFYNRNTERYAN